MSSMQQSMSPRHSSSMSPMRAMRQSNPAASQIPTSSPARQTLHQQLTSTSQPSSRLQSGSVQRTSSPRTTSYRNQQPHPHQYQVQSYPPLMRTPQDTSKDSAAYAQILQQSQQQALRMQVPYNGDIKAQQHPGFNPRYPAGSWPSNRMPHQQQTNNTASMQAHPQYLIQPNNQPHGQSRSVGIRPSMNMQSTPGQYQQQQTMMQQSIDQQKQQRTSSIDKSNIQQPPAVDPNSYQHNMKPNRSNSNSNMTAMHSGNVGKPTSQQSQTPLSTRQQQVATNFTSLLDDDADFNLDTLLAESGEGFLQQLNSDNAPNLPTTVSESKTVDHSAEQPSNNTQLLQSLKNESTSKQISSVEHRNISQSSINSSQNTLLTSNNSSNVMRVNSENPDIVQQTSQNSMQSQFTSKTRAVGQDSLTKLLTDDNIDSLRPMVSSLSNQNKPEIIRPPTSITKNPVVSANQASNFNKNVSQLDTESNNKEQTYKNIPLNATTSTNDNRKISNQSTGTQQSSNLCTPHNSAVNVPPSLSGVNTQQVNTTISKSISKQEKTSTLSYLPQDNIDPTKNQNKVTNQQHSDHAETQEQNVSFFL